jgi:hypothetical protein
MIHEMLRLPLCPFVWQIQEQGTVEIGGVLHFR